MTCACGLHHQSPPVINQGGEEISLKDPLFSLTGRLFCSDVAQMLLTVDLLSEHAEQTQSEPGNLRFDIAQSDNPLVFELRELYANEEAYQAHRARLYDSRWARESNGIKREFTRGEPATRIRAELRHDHEGIADLLTTTFGRKDEARLVRMLRCDGHLALSLVAEAAGTIIGHVALSPVAADIPALALAPVAVHPAVQGRGIGSALIRAAQKSFADHAIVVLGEPDYYERFGFASTDLASPYAGPHLLATGCQTLPVGSRIAHAPAFAMI